MKYILVAEGALPVEGPQEAKTKQAQNLRLQNKIWRRLDGSDSHPIHRD